MSADNPLITVIVPAHQGAQVLPHALSALERSDLPRDRWELIVVDDASTDDTALVAARYADTVVRLGGKPHGPAYSRNRGFEVSRGEVVVFIDADTCVHPDTLSRFAELFVNRPDVDSVFGSYDAEPPAKGMVSQYRNLLHHYMHHRNAGEAETFWAGCGAIRSSVFKQVGMFDEWHYPQPQIEDIELGRRMRQHGKKIILDPRIQVTHLKHWTLGNVLATDFKNRGVPWMRLLLQEGPSRSSDTLNIRTTEKWCTVLVGSGLLAAAAAAVLRAPLLLAGSVAAFGTVLALNLHLYRYLRRQRGFVFALAAIPLHLTYYVINGISVFSGILAHNLFGAPRPPVETEALAQVGIDTWPPAPRSQESVWTQVGEKKGL